MSDATWDKITIGSLPNASSRVISGKKQPPASNRRVTIEHTNWDAIATITPRNVNQGRSVPPDASGARNQQNRDRMGAQGQAHIIPHDRRDHEQCLQLVSGRVRITSMVTTLMRCAPIPDGVKQQATDDNRFLMMSTRIVNDPELGMRNNVNWR